MSRSAEIAVAILNGAVGDYLARAGNGLATEMTFVRDGAPASVTAVRSERARVVVFIHGLMAEESCWRFADGSDYGSRLAEDLGYAPLYVRYNSGLPIAENGARLSALLAALVQSWTVPLIEIVLIGHSMGGLVMRAACHVAAGEDQPWLRLVHRDISIGTPHLGAPLERAGRVLNRVLHHVPDPVTQLVAVIADMRSEGLKDLGDAALRAEDRGRTAFGGHAAHPVPLLPQITHHAIAGTLAKDPRLGALFGDLMVPLGSATGAQANHTTIVRGVSHVGLAHDPTVYGHVRAWLEAA